MSDGIKGIKVDRYGTITEVVMETKSCARDTTMREALQHIAAGHDVLCANCGWVGDGKDAKGSTIYECPQCKSTWAAFKVGTNEIAAYALRQIEGGGE